MRVTIIARLLVVALLAMACGSSVQPADQTSNDEDDQSAPLTAMTGNVVWENGRVKLPDGAVVTVTLADTSIADAPWQVLDQQVIEDADALPLAFRLEYDPAAIDERFEYTLSASIEVGDRLIYINDTVHTVLTGGSPAESDVTVIAVNDDQSAPLTAMTGNVVWENGRVKLPDGAVVTVTLADTSIADAPWQVLDQQVIEDADALPLAFRLEYDPAAIDERFEYTLSASIEVGDRLIYINDTVHTVLTGGSPAESDVTVVAVQ